MRVQLVFQIVYFISFIVDETWRCFEGLFQIAYDLLQFSCPLLLGLLVKHVENQESLSSGYCYSGVLVMCMLLLAFANVHINYLMDKLCIRIRTVLFSLLYNKTCLVKTSELHDAHASSSFTIANISSFISMDIDTIVYAFPCIHLCWSKPIQLFVAFYLLYGQIGVSCVTGIIVVIMLIPLNKILSKKIGTVYGNLMMHKDKRVKVSIVYTILKILLFFYSRTENFVKNFFLNRSEHTVLYGSVRKKFVSKSIRELYAMFFGAIKIVMVCVKRCVSSMSMNCVIFSNKKVSI